MTLLTDPRHVYNYLIANFTVCDEMVLAVLLAVAWTLQIRPVENRNSILEGKAMLP